MRARLPSPATVIAIVALVLAAGGLAVAAIPSADGTIHACYADTGGARTPGTVRIVDEATPCENGEVAISWNQKGPAGAAGPAGPAGANGATGPAGPPGPFGKLIAGQPGGSKTIPVGVTGVVPTLELQEGRWLILFRGDVHGNVYDTAYKYGRVSCSLNGVAHDQFSTPTQIDSAALRFPKVVNSLRKQGQHLAMFGFIDVTFKGAKVQVGCQKENTAMLAVFLGGRLFAVQVS